MTPFDLIASAHQHAAEVDKLRAALREIGDASSTVLRHADAYTRRGDGWVEAGAALCASLPRLRDALAVAERAVGGES